MSILSNPRIWDEVAAGYSETAAVFFHEFSATALRLLPVEKGDAVADIACGPGTLSLLAAAAGARVSAVDISENMLRELEANASRNDLDGVDIFRGDGQSLAFDANTFDAAFSMFGLMFFPERWRGFSELHRILKPKGKACVASFASVEHSALLRHLFAAIRVINPLHTAPEYDVTSLENPKVLRAEMESAGFREVTVHPIVGESHFESAADFFRQMARGSAPLAMIRSAMPAELWEVRAQEAIEEIRREAGPFPRTLGATALLAVGRK